MTPDTEHELRRQLAIERATHLQTKAQLDKALAMLHRLQQTTTTANFRDPYAVNERRTTP